MAETTVGLPSFVRRLSDVLKQRLAGAEVDHEQIRGTRYRLVVVWQGFDDMDHPERQQLVWDIADEVLDKPDLLNVGMIITLGKDDLPQD